MGRNGRLFSTIVVVAGLLFLLFGRRFTNLADPSDDVNYRFEVANNRLFAIETGSSYGTGSSGSTGGSDFGRS